MTPERRTCSPFTQTHWSLIVAARADDTNAGQALAELCGKYWYPLYAFLRRKGSSPQDAEDLIQGFFLHLLQRDWLAGLSPQGGRFRTFLLRCLTHYCVNEWKKQHGPARRPPGGVVALEIGDAEERYIHEPADDESPEKLFMRQYVSELLAQVKTRLRAEYQEAGKRDLYSRLEPHLSDRGSRGVHGPVAAELGMSEGAVRVALTRLRQRFGELLRETVAETVADPTDVEGEMRDLFAAWK